MPYIGGTHEFILLIRGSCARLGCEPSLSSVGKSHLYRVTVGERCIVFWKAILLLVTLKFEFWIHVFPGYDAHMRIGIYRGIPYPLSQKA